LESYKLKNKYKKAVINLITANIQSYLIGIHTRVR